MVDMTFSSRYRNGQILFLTFKKYITEFYAVSSGTSVLVLSYLSSVSEYMGHSALGDSMSLARILLFFHQERSL